MAVKMMSKFLPREVVIASFARTPIGSFLGGLSSLPAAALGSVAISGAIKRAGLEPSEVENVIVGHVLGGGCGQAPARQAAIGSGVPVGVDAYGVNKVCSSGLKAVTLGAQSIALGHADVVVAAGMESMSQAPYYLRNARQSGLKYGHKEVQDAVLLDGLWDPYNHIHMGTCAEKTAKELGISREAQDVYAVESYKRAADGWKGGFIEKEVVPVNLPANSKVKGLSGSSGVTIEQDEEFSKINLDKVASLKPAFVKEGGTITAANASSLNDGAASIVLMSAEKAQAMNITPLARIVSFADAAVAPVDFPVAPHHAVRHALSTAGSPRVDFHEINEAFSAVALANMSLLDLDHQRVNVFGGAVSLGHPLGMSGTRVLMSLLNVLRVKDGTIGCASICNGGGGATAIVVERLK